MTEHVPTLREFLGGTSDEHRIFEVGDAGTFTFHGFSVEEIIALYDAHIEHMRQQMAMARDFQTGQDAVRYVPQGPEDIPDPTAGLDIATALRRD